MMQNHSMHTTKVLGCFLNCMYVFLFTFVVLQEEIHIPHSTPCNNFSLLDLEEHLACQRLGVFIHWNAGVSHE